MCFPNAYPTRLGSAAPWLTLALLVLGTACVPPVTRVDLASVPTEAPSENLTAAQTRTIPLPKEKAFTRAMDVLLDMGFQIRSADQASGQINIAKSWRDPSRSTLSLEATLLFRPRDAGSTTLRMSAIGSWKFISQGGTKSASADVSGVVATDDPAGYRQFLDRLVAEICPTIK
jgi:hypothetical protein